MLADEGLDTLLNDSSDDIFGDVPDPREIEVPVRLVRRPRELAGDSVHIADETAYEDRLIELSDSLGDAIDIVEVDGEVSVERLVRAVARGNIQLHSRAAQRGRTERGLLHQRRHRAGPRRSLPGRVGRAQQLARIAENAQRLDRRGTAARRSIRCMPSTSPTGKATASAFAANT